MRFTMRRRVIVMLMIFTVLGYFWGTWALQVAANLYATKTNHYYNGCASNVWERLGYPCAASSFDPSLMFVALIVTAILFFVACNAVARWALQPAGQISGVVDRLGPQNPGERMTDVGRDELGRLAVAVNRMLDRAAESYESQRRFAANASHELRTPLALQRTLIEVSMTGSPTQDQLDLLARQLLSANQRNEALIEGLLVLAESDRGLASSTPQGLDRIAAETVGNYQALAERAGVTIKTTLLPVTVTGEAVLLERLIANLVHNAIKYNADNGWIEVRVGPGPELRVINTGDRVPEEMLPTLFEPFRRLTGERIDHSGGAGLGLTIARSIVAAHHASLRAFARPEGGLDVGVVFPTGGDIQHTPTPRGP